MHRLALGCSSASLLQRHRPPLLAHRGAALASGSAGARPMPGLWRPRCPIPSHSAVFRVKARSSRCAAAAAALHGAAFRAACRRRPNREPQPGGRWGTDPAVPGVMRPRDHNPPDSRPRSGPDGEGYAPDELDAMSYVDLKKLCKEQGIAPGTRKKVELVAALEAHFAAKAASRCVRACIHAAQDLSHSHLCGNVQKPSHNDGITSACMPGRDLGLLHPYGSADESVLSSQRSHMPSLA
jgi:hypothetical protein